MSAPITTDATRHTVMNALAGGAIARPLLDHSSGLTRAAPSPAGHAPIPQFQGEGIPPEVLATLSPPVTAERRIDTPALKPLLDAGAS